MWVIVMAMVVNGELSFSEMRDYPTKEACEKDVVRVIELHLADGVDLRKIYAECYRKS